jgi:polysaccharide pyruvyl transferase WcaK-like protein
VKSVKKIRIIHFNHNDHNNLNIGDQAHVVAIQEQLRARSKRPIEFIEKSIQLLSYHAVPSIYYFPKSRHYPLAIQNAYRAMSGISAKRIADECNQADMVLIGGGGVYMSYLFPLNNRIIELIKKPIAVFGVGYNHNIGAKPFTARQAKSVQILSQRAALQTVRDENTIEFLRSFDINSAQLMCDPAIFLSERDTGLVKKTARFAIGVNLARHGWNRENHLQERLIQTYTKVFQQLQKSYDVEFFYMMHQPKEQIYYEAFKHADIPISLVKTDDARELKAAYSKLDISLSMMLHSSILAFGAGVPIVEVGYDLKNEAFMELIGQRDLYTTVDNLDTQTLVALISSAIGHQSTIKSQIKKRRTKFKKDYDRYTDQLLGAIA